MNFNIYFFAFVSILPFVLSLSLPGLNLPGLNFPGLGVGNLDPKCRVLEPILTDLLDNLFNNECGDTAHEALRLSFHDAIGISPTLGGGGADGSIIIFNETELFDPGNNGISDVLDNMSPFYFKWANVIKSPGDFIQLAGALSLAFCRGAPRVKFAVGRPFPVAAAPMGLVPGPDQSADQILTRFAEVNFAPEEVIALLAAHSIGAADDLAFPLDGVPFDPTPSIFDTDFFIDVLLNGTLFPPTQIHAGQVMTAINGTLRLQSDFALATDIRTACFWMAYALDQELMASHFADAFFKMGTLGQDPNSLTDCSAIIPQPPPLFGRTPMFPPQHSVKDIISACPNTTFPTLPTQPGPALNVSEVPQVRHNN